MDERSERDLRRQAIRYLRQGQRPSWVARRLGRSRDWVYKWWRRFIRRGWDGLASQSRRPHHPAYRYGDPLRRCVRRVRRALEKAPVGLIGPASVRRHLQQWGVRPLPSRATVARILCQAGLTAGAKAPADPQAYYPHPRPAPGFRLHATDWTCRYLSGGQKVFVFHTLDYGSRNLHHQVFGAKSLPVALTHALSTWRGPLGLPDAVQLDNDIVFMGGHRIPRVIGQFVRLCLAVGVEPIFLPFYEPKRNELVEEIHGLWQSTLWRRWHFRSLGEVQRSQPRFRTWYRHHYFPPALAGRTPAQASRGQPSRRLTARQARRLSGPLPITAGRIHFIRRVDAGGDIDILNERWRVGRRWAGRYVWATVLTQRQRLEVYFRRSAKHKVRRIKTWPYLLSEKAVPLPKTYRRRSRRRKVSAML